MLGNDLGANGRDARTGDRYSGRVDTLMVVNFPKGPINCHHGDDVFEE